MRDSSLTCFDEFAQEGRSAMERHLALLPKDRHSAVLSDVERLVELLENCSTDFQYNRIPLEAKAFWCEAIASHGVHETILGALLLDTLLIGVPENIAAKQIPQLFISEFYEQLQRIARKLKVGPVDYMALDNDIYLKDLGICRLEIYPGRAALIEKHSGIPRSLAFNNGFGQFLKALKLAILSGGHFAPYFELHLHRPMVNPSTFSESGWDRCYHLAAELLRYFPEYHGIIGGSWFFDPEIQKISPNLSYLRQRPLEGGAYFFRVGSSQADIIKATTLSKERQKLHEEGKYNPVSYMMVWPRKKIIAWSKRNQKERP
jgi:hypothetical protein